MHIFSDQHTKILVLAALRKPSWNIIDICYIPNDTATEGAGWTSTETSLTQKVSSGVFIDPVTMPTFVYTSPGRLRTGKIKGECVRICM